MQAIKQNNFGINYKNDRCQIKINVHLNIGIDKSFDLGNIFCKIENKYCLTISSIISKCCHRLETGWNVIVKKQNWNDYHFIVHHPKSKGRSLTHIKLS